MKLVHSCLIALLAGACFSTLPAEEAKAETRFHLNWMLPYFPPPPPRRHYRYYPEPYEDEYGYERDEYEAEVYYYPYYEDDHYGDEEFDPPPRYRPERRKSKRSTTARIEPEKTEQVPTPKRKKPAQAAAPQPKAKPTNQAAKSDKPNNDTAMSCDKAKSIISGYGFGNVEAKSCKGEVYSFAAIRDGKSFSVKVSALSGELTEVKRQ